MKKISFLCVASFLVIALSASDAVAQGFGGAGIIGPGQPPKQPETQTQEGTSSPISSFLGGKSEDDGSSRKAGERMTLQNKGVEYAFHWCPAGTFMMGSQVSEEKRWDGETQHQVTLTKGFWMGETEVTQGMWKAVMGGLKYADGGDLRGDFYIDSESKLYENRKLKDMPRFSGDKKPVLFVSWNDCQDFIQKLNVLGIAPKDYRFSLPTETQWEYACRAKTTTPFNFGSTLNGDKANCNGNYPYGTTAKGQYLEKTTEVGSYPANAWGLYDMHGNVWEWCSDWYYADYPSGSVTDPDGVLSGSHRVVRGGGWRGDASYCRSACRSCFSPSIRDHDALLGWNVNDDQGNGSVNGFRLSLVRAE